MSILVEYAKEIMQKEINTSVGLDFALDGLYVDSKSEKTSYKIHFL
ncbi:MAG: hypothetical protein NTX05_02175 [Fusobacteria bacterium]|nr:hypothetical protein [Fusobacteriota bacterium]